ncbi:MAG: hypothetical protein AAB966_00545 [Patescibacteria group bacterium]
MPEQGESSPRKTWGPQRLPGTDVPVIQQDPIPHIRPLVAKPEEQPQLEPTTHARKFIPFGTPAVVNGKRVRLLQDVGFATEGEYEVVLGEDEKPITTKLGQKNPLDFIHVRLKKKEPSLVIQYLNDVQFRSLARDPKYRAKRKERAPIETLNDSDYTTIIPTPNTNGEIIIQIRENFLTKLKIDR